MIQTSSLQLDLLYKPNRDQLHFGWNDYDPKSLEFPIVFTTPFPTPPAILLSLTELQTDSTLAISSDGQGDPYINLAVSPDKITLTGFNMILTVRRTNSVGKLTVSWLALTA